MTAASSSTGLLPTTRDGQCLTKGAKLFLRSIRAEYRHIYSKIRPIHADNGRRIYCSCSASKSEGEISKTSAILCVSFICMQVP